MARGSRRRTRNLNILIDIHSIILDLKKDSWFILSISISVSLLFYIYKQETYKPTYYIGATYVVSSRGINNDLLTNMDTAEKMASRFTQIINSSILEDKVSEDTGIDRDKIHINANTVSGTNLLTLSVYAETPEMAYIVLKSAMRNYPTLAEYIISDAVMTILVDPVVPTNPDYIVDPFRSILKMFILAVFSLTALCMLVSCLKDTIRSGRDVEIKLSSAFLGDVYHENKRKKRKKESRYGESILITRNTTSFRYTESLKKVCRRVQNRMDKSQFKTLLVTSSFENEGKSTVAANIALAIGEQSKKVVLVDLDFRRPALYKIFDLNRDDKYWLIDAFEGNCEFEKTIQKLDKENIYIVLNNKSSKKSTEIMAQSRLKDYFAYLKSNFDYIVVDSSPMAITADAEVIACEVDASIVIIREHTATASAVNDILDVLDVCHSKMIGCVLNDVRGSVDIGFGGRGYGKYHRYGYRFYDNNYGRPNTK